MTKVNVNNLSSKREGRKAILKENGYLHFIVFLLLIAAIPTLFSGVLLLRTQSNYENSLRSAVEQEVYLSAQLVQRRLDSLNIMAQDLQKSSMLNDVRSIHYPLDNQERLSLLNARMELAQHLNSYRMSFNECYLYSKDLVLWSDGAADINSFHTLIFPEASEERQSFVSWLNTESSGQLFYTRDHPLEFFYHRTLGSNETEEKVQLLATIRMNDLLGRMNRVKQLKYNMFVSDGQTSVPLNNALGLGDGWWKALVEEIDVNSLQLDLGAGKLEVIRHSEIPSQFEIGAVLSLDNLTIQIQKEQLSNKVLILTASLFTLVALIFLLRKYYKPLEEILFSIARFANNEYDLLKLQHRIGDHLSAWKRQEAQIRHQEEKLLEYELLRLLGIEGDHQYPLEEMSGIDAQYVSENSPPPQLESPLKSSFDISLIEPPEAELRNAKKAGPQLLVGCLSYEDQSAEGKTDTLAKLQSLTGRYFRENEIFDHVQVVLNGHDVVFVVASFATMIEGDALCESLLSYLDERMKVTTKLGLSRPCDSITQVASAYREAKISSRSVLNQQELAYACFQPNLIYDQFLSSDFSENVLDLLSSFVKNLVQDNFDEAHKILDALITEDSLKPEAQSFLVMRRYFEFLRLPLFYSFDLYCRRNQELRTSYQAELTNILMTETPANLYRICSDLLDVLSPEDLEDDLDTIRNQKVMKYVEENFKDEQLNVNSIAEAFDLKPNTLSKGFLRSYPDGLLQFIQQVRLKEACQLILEQEKLDIDQVASSVGYSNRFTFVRNFKKHFGVSPSRFHKLNQI